MRGRLLLGAVLAWAALLRITGIGWDAWTHQHPDERFLVMVEEQLAVPGSLAAALSPVRSPLVPENVGFDFYVYGGLPPASVRIVAGALGMADYHGLLVVGRWLAVTMDLLGLLLAVALARRLGGGRAALLAGVLYGSTPLLVQQARFATVDVWGTAFVLLAAWAVVGRAVSIRLLALSAASVGLAAACKPNLALAGAIPAAAAVLDLIERRRRGRPVLRPALSALAVLAVVPVLTLRLADPGAFASAWSLAPSPRRLAALGQLAGFFRGEGQFPPNLQWADRRAVLDPLANLLIWGTGPALGAAVLLGAGRVGRRVLLGGHRWIPLLAWAVPGMAWQLSRMVVSVRHLEPFLPLGVVAAACWLARRRPGVRLAVVALSAAWGLGWAAMAWSPYTRIEAASWLAGRFPAGVTATTEYWDDTLPPAGGAGVRWVTMKVFDPDTVAKREAMLDALKRADAVVLSSQRGVGSICRVPDAYPVTSEYYHLLFSGALGFRLEATFQRRLGIGPWRVSDLAAEESLSVYDHPPVWIFVKTGGYSPALARRLLERVPLPGATSWQTGDLEARGTPPYLERWWQRGRLPGAWRPGPWRQLAVLLLWVAAVEAAGLAGVRLVRRFSPLLPDGGWGAARWVGLAAVGVAWMWLGWLAPPGWNGWLPAVVLAAAAPWAVRELVRAWPDLRYRRVAALVWGVFLVFVAVRAFHPEVYWGEKPMDAGILASLWRADRMPPVDPWFAGSPLNYYFFGFLPYAFLGRAAGAGPGVAFNLAAATVPALAAGAAAAVGWLLSRRWRGGLLAALLVALGGTAAVLVRPAMLLAPSFDTFWASTRVIPDTINEFPAWTALFADLHAHFLGFPGFLVAVLLISAVAVGAARWRRATVLVGAVVAVEAMTNSWEVPLLALLTVAGAWGLPRWRSRIAFPVRAAAAAALVSLPFWTLVRTAGAAVGPNRSAPLGLAGLAELFGPVAVLLAVALAGGGVGRGRPRTTVWAWALAGAGLLAVLAPEVVTVADHMNTVFKLHLQAHLLLAVAAGSLLSVGLGGGRGGLVAVLRAVAAVTVAVMLATTVGAAAGLLSLRRVPGPRPTLDGAAYLAAAAPDQDAVLEALSRLPYAAAVAEPLGPPYGDSVRVPMFTGLPVVVGWQYHLWQRRHAWPEIEVRQHDQAALLDGTDGEMVRALVRRYRLAAACRWDPSVPAAAAAEGWPAVVQRDAAVLCVAPREAP